MTTTPQKTKTKAAPKAAALKPKKVVSEAPVLGALEAPVYNQEGEVVSKVSLPADLFDQPWNPDLVHQVVTVMQANRRDPIAHTKGRGEVRGGGKKPWRQKGTGRARHGSTRSPIWRKGGITHGPIKEKILGRKLSIKMRAAALASVLSAKWRDGEIMFLNDWSLEAPKTKLFAQGLNRLSQVEGFEKVAYLKGNRALVATPSGNAEFSRAAGNLKAVMITEARNLNTLDLLTYRYLILTKPEESFPILQKRVSTKSNV